MEVVHDDLIGVKWDGRTAGAVFGLEVCCRAGKLYGYWREI